MSDDELVAYLREARAGGRPAATRPALAILVFGYWDTLVARARLRLPASDAEDVAGEVIASAIASAFDGSSAGEFHAWLADLPRRVADYHEAKKRRPHHRACVRARRRRGDLGHEPAVAFEGDALFAGECLARAYEELGDEGHRRVVDLYVYGPSTAADVSGELGAGMSEANVHQIASRFQRRFRELLERGDGDNGAVR